MSRVLLLTADKPLSLCDKKTQRSKTVTVQGKSFTITAPAGFMVAEHSYYRSCVDELGHTMKPYQYELDLEVHEDDLADLKAYLSEHLTSGEEIELWNLWVGDEPGPLTHLRGNWDEFDMDTLKQFDRPFGYINSPGQCRMTIQF